jgi:predicted CXXCH cytochrome family protein
LLEALATALCVLLAIGLWLRSWPGPGRVLGASLIGLGSALAIAFAPRAESAPPGAPKARARNGYVSSSACQSCHPDAYASWHSTYHRSMTQLASPKTVLGPFEGTRIEIDGQTLELEQRGHEFWATLPDPDPVDATSSAPLVRRRVIMTTGSHHYQAYWVSGRRGNELRLLPAVYLLNEERWIPRRDAFLQPPSAPARAVRWNSNCVQCHSVGGRPQHNEASDRFATEAIELGIACEACHGPGEAHVSRHQNPAQRYLSRWSEEPDESIVNPRRLSAERSSEICGQCHAYFVPRDEEGWWLSGFAELYRPGQPLEPSRLLLDPGRVQPALIDADFESIFWPDGTIRIGGREYNALAVSACHERGHGEKKLGCLSCHSMHASEPDDQLSEAGTGDAACASCHEAIARAPGAHTHHAPDSPGSRCYGCHMPFTSYALFKGIRSHRIDSPRIVADPAERKPNACNLCHTDRTLAWTAGHLARWYGEPEPELQPLDRAQSATLHDLHAGDAARRVISAYALGRPEARRASGAGFQAAHLALLLDDPYSAVRLVAHRALREQPGFADFDYDFLAPSERRAQAASRALGLAPPGPPDAALLLGADGKLDTRRVGELRAIRDDRPITIAE